MWFPKQHLMSTSTKPESVCFDRWTTAWPCLTPPTLPSPQPPPVHPTPIHPDRHRAACILCLANTSIPTQHVSGLLLSLRLRFTTMWDWFIYISVFFLCFLLFCFFARPDRSSPSAYSVFCKERLCEPKTITTRRCWDCFLRRGLCRQTHNKVSVAEQCFRSNFHQMIHTRGLLDLHDLKLRKENLW